MVTLYGKQWTRAELARHIGKESQLGGVRLCELADGNSRGLRAADVDTGSGLVYTVLLDRGMDVGVARYKGASLVWESATGPVHPAYFEEEGRGWLRSFHGGMVVTCGMTTAGAAAIEDGEDLGLHGRISHTPAANVWTDGAWRGDEYEMWVRGKMRQAAVFGENLVMDRRIWSRLGESRLMIRDLVTNEGTLTTPHMLLYHVNFGFPLLAEGTELLAPSRRVAPRDAIAAPGLGAHNRYEAPIDGYQEQCFYHDLVADGSGYVTVVLANRAFGGAQGLGVYLKYRQAELPIFTQWKMVCAGTYITGLEPANCRVEGRPKERAEGRLQFLEPGESRETVLEIGVLGSNAEIDALVAGLPKA